MSKFDGWVLIRAWVAIGTNTLPEIVHISCSLIVFPWSGIHLHSKYRKVILLSKTTNILPLPWFYFLHPHFEP